MSDGNTLLDIFEKLQINLGTLNTNVVRAWFDTDDPDVLNFLRFICSLNEENCLKPEEYEEFEEIQNPIYGKELENSCSKLEEEFPAIFDKTSNLFVLNNKHQQLEQLHEEEVKLDHLLEMQERLHGSLTAEKMGLDEEILKLGNIQDILEKNISEISDNLDEKTQTLHSKLMEELDVLSTFSCTTSEFLNRMSLNHLDDPAEFHRKLRNLIREQSDIMEASRLDSEVEGLEQKLIKSRTEFLRLKFEEAELVKMLKEMSGKSILAGKENKILDDYYQISAGNLGKSTKFLEHSCASIFESSHFGKSGSFEEDEADTENSREAAFNLDEKLDKILEEFTKPIDESIASSVSSVKSEEIQDYIQNEFENSKMPRRLLLQSQILSGNQLESKGTPRFSKESEKKLSRNSWENPKMLEEVLQSCFNCFRLRENNLDIENFHENLKNVMQISNYYGKLSMLIATSLALFVQEEEQFKHSLKFIEKVSRFNNSNRICDMGEILENYCERYFENNCAMMNSLYEMLDTKTFDQSYKNMNKLNSDLKVLSRRLFECTPINMDVIFNSVLLKFLISRETNKILAITPQLRKCFFSVCTNLDKQSSAIKHLAKLNSSTVKYLKENDNIKLARLIWIYFLVKPEKLKEIDEKFKLEEIKAVRFKD